MYRQKRQKTFISYCIFLRKMLILFNCFGRETRSAPASRIFRREPPGV